MAIGKKNWSNIKIPSEWRSSADSKWQRYLLGEEAGDYQGWTLSHPVGLVRSENIKVGNGAIEIPTDSLIFNADNHTFYLRKGKASRTFTAVEGIERLGNIIKAFEDNKVTAVLNDAEDQLAIDAAANKAEFEREEAAKAEAAAYEPTAEEFAKHLSVEQQNLLSEEQKVVDIDRAAEIADFSATGKYEGNFDEGAEYVYVSKDDEKHRTAHFLQSNVEVRSENPINNPSTIEKFLNDAMVEERKTLDDDELVSKKTYYVVSGQAFENLRSIKNEIDALYGCFDEDVLASEDGQVLQSQSNQKYLPCKNEDCELNENYEIRLTDKFAAACKEKICKGEQVFYDDLYEAGAALYGGESASFNNLSEGDKKTVTERYNALAKGGEWDILPTKERFVKDFLIEKNQAKWKNYVNTKNYENNIPYVLRNGGNFVCWRLSFNGSDGEPLLKPAKLPVNPNTGGLAMPNNPSTWGSFEQACQGVDKYKANGIGIVFNGRGAVGIDLDGCIKDGKVSDFAMDIVKKVNSYTEISPSGTGLHILAFGKLPANINNQSAGIEMYSKSHFVILTGNRLKDTPMAMAKTIDAQPVLSELYEQYKPVKAELNRHGEKFRPVEAPKKASASSVEIVNRMKKSANFDKYLRCAQGKAPYEWDAKTHSFTNKIDKHFLREDGSPDLSALDLAFCKGLVFFKATPEQIDEIYRAQNLTKPVPGLTLEDACLARPKWDKNITAGGQSYGEYVIAGAFAGTSSTWGANSRYNKINAAKAAKKGNFNEGAD